MKVTIFLLWFFVVLFTVGDGFCESDSPLNAALSLITSGKCDDGVEQLRLLEDVSINAQYSMGVLYLEGICVQKNYDKAYKYFLESGDKGSVSGQFNLALMFYNGLIENGGKKAACKWFYRASQALHCDAQYFTGLCIDKDYLKGATDKESRYYYSRGAKCGDDKSMFMLAMKYINPKSSNYDYLKAKSLLDSAYNKGNIDATYNLGVMFQNGYGVTKDLKRAFLYYEEGSRRGNGPSSFNAYTMLRDGLGVDVDSERADEYLIKSANQGFHQAQFVLGYEYIVSKDKIDEGRELLKASAKQGFEPAIQALSLMQK